MVSDGMGNTLEMPRERQATAQYDKEQAFTTENSIVKRTRKTYKKRNADLPVPAYVLVTGKDYDVSGMHTSIQDAEYMGHEIIGRLVLYCFRQGKQPYKFSEYAIRTGGGIWESDTGVEIHATPAKKAGKQY